MWSEGLKKVFAFRILRDLEVGSMNAHSPSYLIITRTHTPTLWLTCINKQTVYFWGTKSQKDHVITEKHYTCRPVWINGPWFASTEITACKFSAKASAVLLKTTVTFLFSSTTKPWSGDRSDMLCVIRLEQIRRHTLVPGLYNRNLKMNPDLDGKPM